MLYEKYNCPDDKKIQLLFDVCLINKPYDKQVIND